MKKLTLLVGAAVGYVLGARAGRERYEKIKSTATRAKDHPKVQEVADDVETKAAAAATSAASSVKETVTDAVKRTDAPTDVSDEVPPPGSTS